MSKKPLEEWEIEMVEEHIEAANELAEAMGELKSAILAEFEKSLLLRIIWKLFGWYAKTQSFVVYTIRRVRK